MLFMQKVVFSCDPFAAGNARFSSSSAKNKAERERIAGKDLYRLRTRPSAQFRRDGLLTRFPDISWTITAAMPSVPALHILLPHNVMHRSADIGQDIVENF